MLFLFRQITFSKLFSFLGPASEDDSLAPTPPSKAENNTEIFVFSK